MNYLKTEGPSNGKKGDEESLTMESIKTTVINLENPEQLSASFSLEFSQAVNQIKDTIELLEKPAAVEAAKSNGVSGNCAAPISKLLVEPIEPEKQIEVNKNGKEFYEGNAAPTSKLLVEPIEPEKQIEVNKNGKEFYEGNAIVIRPEGSICYFVSISDENILLEYEQAFYCTRKIVDTVPRYNKYEIFLMLYPMMAIGYLQLILGERLERATAFLEEAAAYLDQSYSRRIEKLRLIRTSDDLPERALELLASEDFVEVAMAYPTYHLYISHVAGWTRGQQDKLLKHFVIRSYTDEEPLREWALPGVPHLEPIVNSVDLPPYWPLDRENLPAIYTYAPTEEGTEVLCCAPSADLSMVALGFSNHSVCITVDVDKIANGSFTSKGEITLVGHKGPIASLAFSPQDHFLVSASQDFSMRLWGVGSWTCVSVYPNQLCAFVTFAPRGFVFAATSYDGIARLWGRNTMKPLLKLSGHLAVMEVCQFHFNGHYLATGSADCTVRVWDIQKGGQVRVFRGHKGSITSLVYSICGRYLISGAHDSLIIVWDTISGWMVRTLKFHTSVIHSIAIDVETNTLAVGGDVELSVWNLQLILKHPCHRTGSDSDTDPHDKESSSQPRIKDLLYGSCETLGASLRYIRFVGRNVIMAINTAGTNKKKSEHGAIQPGKIAKGKDPHKEYGVFKCQYK